MHLYAYMHLDIYRHWHAYEDKDKSLHLLLNWKFEKTDG